MDSLAYAMRGWLPISGVAVKIVEDASIYARLASKWGVAVMSFAVSATI